MPLQIKNKLNYLLLSVKKFILSKGYSCPYCKNDKSETVSRKFLITSLKKCNNCNLLFKCPTWTTEESNKFYQKNYSQNFTTDYPNDEELKNILKNDFKYSDKNYSNYLSILRNIKDNSNIGDNLFDYGCSWGYGSYQLGKIFNVSSFEISKPRAKFAKEKLNINILNQNEIDNLISKQIKFDFFFMSHVLEHLPEPKKTIELAFKLLKKNGYFVSFTPNGSVQYRKKNPKWNKLWGLVHPNLIDENFYQKIFSKERYFIGSSLCNLKNLEIFLKNDTKSYTDDLSGSELLIIVKKIY